MAAELRHIVRELHKRGITHGDISQRKIFVQRVNRPNENSVNRFVGLVCGNTTSSIAK